MDEEKKEQADNQEKNEETNLKKIKYGQYDKNFIFKDTDKRHADLFIRLQYDGLSKSEFFRGMITGYLEKNENLMKYIEELKDKKGKMGKTRRKRIVDQADAEKETIRKFALDKEEKESIFDILEEEFPDL